MVYRPSQYAYAYQLWVIDAEVGVDVQQTLAESPTFAGWSVTQIGTLESLFREQFIAKRSMEIVLSAAAAFALLPALAGVANSLSRSIGEARSPIGIRLALGATAGELAGLYLGTSVCDLALAGAAVCGLALVVKLAAPAFAGVLALWLVVPALACLVGVCAMMSHLLVGQMARRNSVSALVHGTVAGAGPADRRMAGVDGRG